MGNAGVIHWAGGSLFRTQGHIMTRTHRMLCWNILRFLFLTVVLQEPLTQVAEAVTREVRWNTLSSHPN